MKPILIRKLSTLKRFGAEIVLKDNKRCAFVRDAEIKESGNPLLELVQVGEHALYIPKTMFLVERENDIVKICPINLLKLGPEHPLFREITNEVYKYYANGFSTMDVVRSTGIPHQLLAEVMKCCPFLTKRQYKSLEKQDIPLDEILEAYKNDNLEDLATRYHTTVLEVLELLLKYFKKQKRNMVSILRSCVVYKMRKGNHVYLYVPHKSSDGKSLKYVGREDQVANVVNQEIDNKRADIGKRISEIEAEIANIEHKMQFVQTKPRNRGVKQYG